MKWTMEEDGSQATLTLSDLSQVNEVDKLPEAVLIDVSDVCVATFNHLRDTGDEGGDGGIYELKFITDYYVSGMSRHAAGVQAWSVQKGDVTKTSSDKK
jgi:hypothetical protein